MISEADHPLYTAAHKPEETPRMLAKRWRRVHGNRYNVYDTNSGATYFKYVQSIAPNYDTVDEEVLWLQWHGFSDEHAVSESCYMCRIELGVWDMLGNVKRHPPNCSPFSNRKGINPNPLMPLAEERCYFCSSKCHANGMVVING